VWGSQPQVKWQIWGSQPQVKWQIWGSQPQVKWADKGKPTPSEMGKKWCDELHKNGSRSVRTGKFGS